MSTADMLSDALAELPGLATIAQTAQALQCSTRTVVRMIDSGRLRATRVARIVRVPRRAIEELLTGGAT